MKFSEVVRLLEQNGFRLIKRKVQFGITASRAWTG